MAKTASDRAILFIAKHVHQNSLQDKTDCMKGVSKPFNPNGK
jgi:hypothetical protein